MMFVKALWWKLRISTTQTTVPKAGNRICDSVIQIQHPPEFTGHSCGTLPGCTAADVSSHLHVVLKSHPRAKRGTSESFSDFAKEVQSSRSVHAFDQVHTQCLNSAVLSPKQYLNSTFQVECGLGFKLPRGHLLADALLCFAPERI